MKWEKLREGKDIGYEGNRWDKGKAYLTKSKTFLFIFTLL